MTSKQQALVAQIPRLRRYANALTGDPALADDLVQGCLDRALTRLHLWREGTNMRAWLMTMLRNLHVSHLRRLSRHPDETPVALDSELPGATPPSQEKELAIQDIGRALARLPDEQRGVVLLIGLEELSYKETAEILGIPVGTVMSRLSRGREHLRRLMQGENRENKPSLRRVK